MATRPQTKPELTKSEMERYINKIAEKTRLLARLCAITTASEASKYTTKLVLFDFKVGGVWLMQYFGWNLKKSFICIYYSYFLDKQEVSTIILEVMDKFSTHVAVTEIYDATVALEKMEKFVISELEVLQTRGKQVWK